MKTPFIYLFVLFSIAEMSCAPKGHSGDPAIAEQRNGVQVNAKFLYRHGGKVGQVRFSSASADSEASQLFFDVQFERPGFEPDKKTLNYLDFQIENDFSLANTGDTLSPTLVHRVANGRKDVFEYVVAFEKDSRWTQSNPGVSIIYQDKVFGLGQQVFMFRKEDISMATDKTN
jgi:hypothetical protein